MDPEADSICQQGFNQASKHPMPDSREDLRFIGYVCTTSMMSYLGLRGLKSGRLVHRSVLLPGSGRKEESSTHASVTGDWVLLVQTPRWLVGPIFSPDAAINDTRCGFGFQQSNCRSTACASACKPWFHDTQSGVEPCQLVFDLRIPWQWKFDPIIHAAYKFSSFPEVTIKTWPMPCGKTQFQRRLY